VRPFKDLWRGIKRHPWKTTGYVFTAFSVLFTIIKGINQFFPGVKIEGVYAFTAIILVSFGYGLKKVWKPSKIKIKIANSDTIIEVLFGDLFVQDGIRAVAVNEFFDSALGKPVSEKSLHGLFLNKCFGGYPEPFDKQVDEQLANEPHEIVPRVEGKTKKYKIGTTTMLNAEKDRYLVFALTHTDVTNSMATADVTMMWVALHHVWQRARAECGGSALNLPLVGGGLAKIGLPTRDLLNLIILAAITETKEKVITQRIRIVLHRDRFEDLDLRDVENHWKE
jgi:Thoeris protein ThsA, Macro domain